jgi:F-type H+-transporting ATPase subunit b
MEVIFTTFGIDWRLLLIQGLNFGIHMVGLWYFLYGPVMRLLEERRAKVSRGVADAEAAAKQLEGVESERRAMLAQTGKEADEIISHAHKRGSDKERELVAHAEASAASVLAQAQAQAREYKERAVSESKEDVAKLIVLGVEKMLKDLPAQAGKRS